MQYWDKNGNIHDDSSPNAGIVQQAYNKAIAGLTNAKNWLNEENSNSKAYKQKINTILGIESLFTPTALRRVNPLMSAPATEPMVKNFFDKTNPKIKDAPSDYEGNRNMSELLKYLGSKNNKEAKIKSPIETIKFDRSDSYHFLNDNEPERLRLLNRLVETIKEPSYIIKEFENGHAYNGYYKSFKDKDKIDGYFGVFKQAPDGVFYSTSRPIKANNLRKKINNGQVIYNNLSDQTAPILKNMSVNNIINDLKRFFNP